MTSNYIEIDASNGSGGGEILRTATALSVITKTPCRIFNIRKKRTSPGLKESHLSSIRGLAELTGSQIKGDYLSSSEIEFIPGEQQHKKEIKIKIKTAGSITLALQNLLIAALQGNHPIQVSFEGGATDTFFSPTLDHLQHVLGGMIELITGQKAMDFNVKRRGFYPKGEARVDVELYPIKLKPFKVSSPGKLKMLRIISGASQDLRHKKVAERQISGVKEILSSLKLPIQEKVEYYKDASTGSQITLIGEFERSIFGVDNLGKLGKSAEIVGQEAGKEFLEQGKSGAPIDKHTGDQLLPYLAIAENSQITVPEITEHIKTNIWTIKKFLSREINIENTTITIK